MDEMNVHEDVQARNLGYASVSSKPQREYTPKEAVLATVAVVLGFLMIKLIAAPLADGKGFGLGAAIVNILFTVYACVWPKQNGRGHILRMILCFAFSVNIFISSNTFLQFLDIAFVWLMLVYDRLAITGSGIGRIRNRFVSDLMSSVFVQPFASFGVAPAAISQYTSKSKTSGNIKNILIGLVIAVPSTFFVAMLLSDVDKGFSDIMENLFSNIFDNIFVTCLQIIFAVPVAFYIFGSCYSSAHNELKISERQNIFGFVPAMAGVASAVPVCVLYVIFFFSQLSHYLSAFVNKLPEDEIYSSYARDGFFQLCAVAVINLMIIVFLNFVCKFGENGREKSIRVMTFIMCMFTLLLIATAVRKMVLYIDVYGLTLLRTYTTWFMGLLTVIFIAAAVFAVKEDTNVPRIVVTAFTVMFAFLSFCNVDGLIAEYNISRYESGTLSRLAAEDYKYLSSGAYPALRRALVHGDFKGEDGAEASAMLNAEQRSEDIRTLTVMDIYSDMCAGRR